ncbi:Alpha/Beta hydrolase protein [Aspergillus caelatus]|uniref:Alpha/Beta hydrolase protein n=1 Tax=Aspergillus caelatus TaxID=61420 RepID=A0A5N6ZZ78_9EURO|nr:Alpha/Beta hydrolase protein [Aspergillus caelatus]KAE8362638.1 Alpha/Beta hydrolase protein [Aspergillus caelatus]
MPLADVIQRFIAQIGNHWGPSVNAACEEYFESCHATVPEPLNPIYASQKNIKYGEHERHRLNVYWPQSIAKTERLPVVVYFHGGAFKGGDNEITPHLHANIGKFFASNNMIGVLGTYRLLPEARFPDGIEDVTSALQWIKANVHHYGGDADDIFAIGQSAGGGHLAMALFSGRLQQQNAMPRGVMLQSAALHYDLSQEPRRLSMIDYYATHDLDRIMAQSAMGLFSELVTVETRMPKLFVTIAEFDFKECVQGNLKLMHAFSERMGYLPEYQVLQGHNHVSYCLSIGLQGDEVGPRIVKWVRECLGTNSLG